MSDPAAVPEHYSPFTFPRPCIVRLATKTGRVYEMAKRWHEPVDEKTTFIVSFIVEHGEEREQVETDEDENDLESVTAHHYEVWAVSPRFMGLVYKLIMASVAGSPVPDDFAQKFTEAMEQTPGTRVRVVLASEVEYVEREIRDMKEAWEGIQDHFEEVLGVRLASDGGSPAATSTGVAAAAPNGG